MRTLKVDEICGKHCLSPEEGEILYKELHQALQRQEDILLDFRGIDTIASSFLNTAVGRLYGRFEHSFLDSKLSWTGLDPQDERVLRIVIENAKDHFRKPETLRKVAARIAYTAPGE